MKSITFGRAVNGGSCIKIRDFLLNENLSKIMQRKRITSCVIDELYIGMEKLWKEGEAETISTDAKNLYESFGFEITETGIGWKVG